MTRHSEFVTRLILVYQCFGLSAFWGLVLGTALGFVSGSIFGLLSLSLSGLLFMWLWVTPAAAFFGTLLGGVSGLVLGIVTAIFYYRPRRLAQHKYAAMLIIPFITFFSLFLWFLQPSPYVVSGSNSSPLGALLLAAVAALVSVYGSRKVAWWYLKWHYFNYVEPLPEN